MHMKLGIVGAGTMARAIVAGLLARNIWQPQDIIGTARTPQTREAFCQLAPPGTLRWAATIEQVVDVADIVLLAVKPQQLRDILPAIGAKNAAPLYLSIIAGVPMSLLASSLPPRTRLVRAMPNMPAHVGFGASAFACNEYVNSNDITMIETIFKAVGEVYRVEESQLNIVTALSGSGPAYFYLFIDYLARAAVDQGLEASQALKIATQTALGAAQMLQQTGLSAQTLIEQVCSKGGTTEAALLEFKRQHFDQLCHAVVKSACVRAQELSSSSF